MIKTSTLTGSKFLHSIGSSAGEQKDLLVKSVLDKARRRQVIDDIGIGTSLSKDDIKGVQVGFDFLIFCWREGKGKGEG